MLLSMTGFGSASTRANDYLISSEIKAVNNRYLKTTIKLPEGFASLETKIDEVLRQKLARGTVNLVLKLDRLSSEVSYEINFDALRYYYSEAQRFIDENETARFNQSLGSIVDFLRLPGAIQDRGGASKQDLAVVLQDAILKNISEALDSLQAMRQTEGASTATYLKENLDSLRLDIAEVKKLAPTVVDNYRARLTERVGKVLAENGAVLDPADLIREVAVYTDRVDISEEIARFYSHLDQFDATMEKESACGKKLDFLTQEMFRETNTIGSKANSPDILKYVVEMKSTIERIREMVQNVE